MFKIIFPDKDNKEINNKTEKMLKYYTHEQEKEYGVIGIEIEIINSNFRYTYNKLVRDKIPENIDNMKGRKSKYKKSGCANRNISLLSLWYISQQCISQ